MENEIVGLKKKFALLINCLIASGFSYELIEERILKDPFFLFMENNEVANFLKTPIETIVKNVFKKEIYIDYDKPLISEYVWVGEMYITLSINLDIPLQRVVLLLPIAVMLSLFNPYHEMSNSHLMERYQNDFSSNSVLKLFMREANISIRKLSILLNIKEKTLLSYQKNDILFNASINNVYRISSFFNVPVSLFLKHSNYSPFEPSFLNDDVMLNNFKTVLANYLGLNIEQLYLDIEQMMVRKKNKTYYLSDKEIKLLGKQALELTLNNK